MQPAQILGIIDMVAAITLLFNAYRFKAPLAFVIVLSILLIGKGFISILNFFGWFDIFVAILLILGVFFNLPFYLLIVVLIGSGSKGLASMF